MDSKRRFLSIIHRHICDGLSHLSMRISAIKLLIKIRDIPKKQQKLYLFLGQFLFQLHFFCRIIILLRDTF